MRTRGESLGTKLILSNRLQVRPVCCVRLFSTMVTNPQYKVCHESSFETAPDVVSLPLIDALRHNPLRHTNVILRHYLEGQRSVSKHT
jgi:hypothetical protein